MVEIAKALARKPKILILDEATSALTSADVEVVFKVLKQLREEGMAIVYISHRMHEIEELADDCTVFRNGRHVATFPAGTKGPDEIIEMMIGREVQSVFPPRPARKLSERPAFEVRGLSWAGRLKDLSFAIPARRGGGAGRARRAGPARAPAGALRGAQGSLGVGGGGRQAHLPRQPRGAAGPPAWSSSRRIGRPRD